MPNMFKDGLKIAVDVSQVPALLAAGWTKSDVPAPTPKGPVKVTEEDIFTMPSIKAVQKEATDDVSKPARFTLLGDWVKDTQVKVKFVRKEDGKTKKFDQSWALSEDAENPELAAIAMMETFELDNDIVIWAEKADICISSAQEGVSFEISFDRPKLNKV